MSSHAVRKRLRANPDLKAIADECIATSLDYAEMTIVREIMQGNIRVCMWYLDRFGKARGYGKNAKFKIQPTPRSSVVLYALERTV